MFYLLRIILAVIAVTGIIKAVTAARNKRRRSARSAMARTPQAADSAICRIAASVPASTPPAPPPVNTPSAITELGPVNYYANDSHNSPDVWFQFQYKKVGDKWLTYIARMPGLQGRDPNLHLTHRYTNGSTYWICRDPQPANLKDAQAVSRVWADCITEYIATGKTF